MTVLVKHLNKESFLDALKNTTGSKVEVRVGWKADVQGDFLTYTILASFLEVKDGIAIIHWGYVDVISNHSAFIKDLQRQGAELIQKTAEEIKKETGSWDLEVEVKPFSLFFLGG